jgi:uncharacterized protein
MIVVDTTVLVYAKGGDHPLRDPCLALMTAVADDRLEATTSPEVIQEFVHVRARRRDRRDAASLGRAYAELFSPLMTITDNALRRGLSLFEQVEQLGAFDAVLAAGAAGAGASAIVSADAAFAAVTDVRHVVPDAAGIAALLDS